MLDRLFGFKIQDYLQALGLGILAFGLPMNKVLMSIGTIWLAANVLLKADFKEYWKLGKKNVVFWFICLVLVLHLLGLLYTSDFSYAFKDINSKLPLFVIPVALIVYPIRSYFLPFILGLFLLSLLITSGINFNYMQQHGTIHYRDFSLFGSHIRYSLLIVMGILVSFHLAKKNNLLVRFFLLIIIVWLGYYTLISQVMNGYIALLFLGLAVVIWSILKLKSIKLKTALLMTITVGFGLISFLFYQEIRPPKKAFSFQDLPQTSLAGSPYFHDFESLWFENGNHVLSCIAEEELEQAWNSRMQSIKYNEKFEDGYILKDILIRYMASKGLTKDKEGMNQMSDHDVKNVENGISTIVHTYFPLKRQLAILKNELVQYEAGGDPNGNSLLQRFEHWKAAKGIIKENWIFGIGTGDVQASFDEQYIKNNSRLHPENWKRAHNQYLTFWITFGIMGFLIFTVFWFWFLWKNIQLQSLFGIGFALIAIASFLSEDTIETQQGVTFVALFLGITVLLNQFSSSLSQQKG